MEKFIGVLGILGSPINCMEKFIGVLGILGSTIYGLEEFRGFSEIMGSIICTREKFTTLNSPELLTVDPNIPKSPLNSSKMLIV